MMSETTSNKSVSFNQMVVRITIDCDYTPEEIESIWFEPADYTKMKKRDKVIARKVAETNNEKNFCLLGLVDDESRYERRERIRESNLAVFEEQEKQWAREVVDDESLAAACYEYSHHSSLLALERGLNLTVQLKEDALAKSKKTCRALRKSSTESSSKKNSKKHVASHSPEGAVVSPKKSKISKFLSIGSKDRKMLVLPSQ